MSITKTSRGHCSPDTRRQEFESSLQIVAKTLAATSPRNSIRFDQALDFVNKSLLVLAGHFLCHVRSKAYRDDLVQEALQIWHLKMLVKGYHSYLSRSNGRPITPFAIRTLYNICISLLRKQNRFLIIATVEEFSDNESNPAETAEMEEFRSAVKSAMTKVPPLLREALRLTYWEGLSNREAALRLRTNPGTIATRNRRGRRMIEVDLRERGYWPL